MWWFIFTLAVGALLGAVIGILMSCRPVGVLKVIREEGEAPYLFLALTKGMDRVLGRKYVVMKVETLEQKP